MADAKAKGAEAVSVDKPKGPSVSYAAPVAEQKAFSKHDNVTKSCGAAFLATSPSAMQDAKERDVVQDLVVCLSSDLVPVGHASGLRD